MPGVQQVRWSRSELTTWKFLNRGCTSLMDTNASHFTDILLNQLHARNRARLRDELGKSELKRKGNIR